MSASLRWIADGIEVAERAGGITLELYRCPGFVGETRVRRRPGESGGCGVEIDADGNEKEEEDLDAHPARR